MRRVDIGLAAETDEILHPLSAAVMTGMLTPVVGRRNVNYVNALHLADARNIAIGTRLLGESQEYSEFLEVVLETERQKVRVCGALLGEQLHPRIVQIDEFGLSVKPEGCLVVLRNKDVPGVIGKVGTLLGTHGLNIAEYMQARQSEGGEALAAITVDGKVGSSVLAALHEEDEISDARAVFLGD
jgi:D-3-phosphoglycerate dehydrogenase